MNWLSTIAPAIAADELATTSSWWWIIELSLVGLLLLSSAFVAGLIVRSGRDESTEDDGVLLKRPVLWISIAFALMAVTGLLFMPETKSADHAWLSWFVVAASVVFVIAGGMFSAKLMQTVFSRQIRDRIFHGFCISVTSFSVLTLVIMMSAIGYLGWKYLSWDLVTSFASRDAEKAGVKAALWGTIWICLLCAFFAIPIGTATALYLEEYSKKGRLHRIIDLNISNLAGVPSIVYGIIGLTIFARMFGLFGGINEPSVQIGAQHYDSYLSASGDLISVPLADRNVEPGELVDGTSALDSNMNKVNVKIVPDETESDEAGAVWASDAKEPTQRYEDRSWYYLQLPFGGTVLAGGLTLALVVLPIVIVASREAIRSVPPSLREAAMGCGATRWQTVRKVILPAATPGIMTGSILAVSRAMGEAAPLLVLTGILFIRFTPEHLMDDFTAMPLQIYNWAQRPQEEFHAVAASGIVVLLFLLLGFNAVAVLIRQYFQKPQQ